MKLVLSLFATAICAATFAVAQPSIPPADAILASAQATFPEYLESLTLPNDAVNAADVQKNADWFAAAFRKRGFPAPLLPNQGKPLVFAEWPRRLPGAKTVLFYMHIDGQPVLPEQWAQKSPWTPVVKQRNAAGKWDVVDPAQLQAPTLDPELRVFGRSSSDDKGPIMMFLAAFDALKAAGMEPRAGVKV